MGAFHIMEQVAALRSTAPVVDLHDRAKLIANLVFVHQVAVASEELLQLAHDCESSAELRDYFAAHRDEERGHAQWLADDLATLGVDITKQPLSRTAVAMAGSMYYMIRHVSPLCLLGYMLVLECFPMPLSVVEDLERTHGEKAMRTVRYHAKNDIDHGADLRKVIDEQNCPEIQLCAIETARYINEFTMEIA